MECTNTNQRTILGNLQLPGSIIRKKTIRYIKSNVL